VSADPARLARRWAQELPVAFARRLADALRQGPLAVEQLESSAVLPNSAYVVRQAADLSRHGHGPYAAGVLTALLDSEADLPQITPVWTGPDSQRPGGRLTLAVLADLIDQAEQSILLASYATLPSPQVRSALEAAVNRGVEVTLLLERASDNPGFSGPDDPLPGLSARRMHWPVHRRPSGAAMHAKVLVIDDHLALVGSANLTGAALERNLECGLLIRGGSTPAALREHLLSMIDIEPLS
jgi:phosphatidylserine/phosphatidylglycerophosphate/cardiolipin synthase-like enzyme